MACEAVKMDGFKHCVRTPQNYAHVAKIIQKIQEDGLGIKYSVYGNNKDNTKFNKNNQRNLALTTKILEKSQIIEHILRKTQILIKEPRLDPWLARVLIHELVWRKDFDHACKPMQTINKYKKELREASENYEGEFEPLEPTERVIKPRYIRINTFKISTAEVIEALRNDGLMFMPSIQETYSEYLEAVANLSNDQFMIDFHIKDMLVFGPGFQFIRHEFYQNSIFILQDKASCLAPLLLDPPEGGVVLDMCAAPGMKTNYLANLVGSKGRVYAVEKHRRRYVTLSELIHAHGLKNVLCMHRDATSITGDELADVEYILVDPSCSGSGIINRIDFEGSNPERLELLSRFQITILRHALTRFPNVKRVAYSTCSIHAAENEVVVTEVLDQVKDFKLVNLQEKLKPNWNNFGLEEYEHGPSCLYSNSEQDFTNGFFVAIFERVANSNHTSKRKYKEKENINQNEQENTESFSKKKKFKNNNEFMGESNNIQETIEENYEYVKEKKKENIKEEIVENVEELTLDDKKKKKEKRIKNEIVNVEESTLEEKPKKKKEKKIKDEIIDVGELTSEEKKLKKRKKNIKEETVDLEEFTLEEKPKKKEKKVQDEMVEEPILKEKTKKKKSDKTVNMEETIIEDKAEEQIKEKKQVDETINLEEIEIIQDNVGQKKKTKKRKKTEETVAIDTIEKSNQTIDETITIDESMEHETKVKDKKKKKKKMDEQVVEQSVKSAVDENNAEEKKKTVKTVEEPENVDESIVNGSVKDKKKKKKKMDATFAETDTLEISAVEENNVEEKKKKRKKSVIGETSNIEETIKLNENSHTEKKKKTKTIKETENMIEATVDAPPVGIKSKKKKSKKIIDEIENIEESLDEEGIEEKQKKAKEHYLEELKEQQWMKKMYQKIAKTT